MKKLSVLFFSLLAIFFAVCLRAEKKAPISSEAVNVIIDGEAFLGASVYKISQQTNYFSVREVAEMYNAVLEWKPVSYQVTMHLNNSKIDIKANSVRVVFGKKTKRMSIPSRFINNDIYIPPEILTSKEFREISEAETVWNATSSVLKITHKLNISAVRYFTKPENTQVVIQLETPLSYDISRSSNSAVIKIARGRLQHDIIHVDNGVVRDIVCSSQGRLALVKINFQQPPKFIKTSMLSKPDRISVDIVHSKNIDISNMGPKEIVIVKPEKEHSAHEGETAKADLTRPEKYGQAQISEITSLSEYENEEDKDLKRVPVARFESETIIDDSFKIIDDTLSAPGIIPERKSERKSNNKFKRIIVLDAGHGGQDPGAIGPGGTKEKDINLDIVYELKALFDNNEDYKIILTRRDDTFIPLVERANVANDSKADLFISVHCNANLDRNINVFEIYALSESGKASDSEAAATAVLENSVLKFEEESGEDHSSAKSMLVSLGMTEIINDSLEVCGFITREASNRLKIPSGTAKQANFYVLRGTHMPAVLVESAFISNYAQEARFGSKKFIVAVADSIYEGVVKYYAKKDKKQNGK